MSSFVSQPVYGRAGLPAGALAGVRTRRMLAVGLDLIVVSILSFGLWLGLAVLTLGLTLVLLPSLFPAVGIGPGHGNPRHAPSGPADADGPVGRPGPVHQCCRARCPVLFQLDVPSSVPGVAR